LPVFREFWGWAAFAVLAIAGLATVVATTEWNGFWDFAIAVGHKVEPLWVSSAILVYTVAEGVAMLAKAFDRKLRAKYMAEGKAEGKAEGEAETLSALQEAAKRRGADLAEIQDVIEEARKIVRNGRP
jgi:hypothetical protein